MFVRLCRCKSNVWLAAGGDAIFSLSEKTADEMWVLQLESNHKAKWSKECYGDWWTTVKRRLTVLKIPDNLRRCALWSPTHCTFHIFHHLQFQRVLVLFGYEDTVESFKGKLPQPVIGGNFISTGNGRFPRIDNDWMVFPPRTSCGRHASRAFDKQFIILFTSKFIEIDRFIFRKKEGVLR